MINLNNKLLLMVPLFFFIFLSLFIFFKFIFIFFFRAAFEPSFIFELTPFYVLAGLNNLQLLFLSLIVVFLDTYLHIKATRKNLLYSFIPTSLMLSGSGVGIITHGISINILLFGLLLFVILIDHRRTLLYPDTLAAAQQPAEPGPASEMSQPQQAALGAGRARPSISAISSIFSIFKRGKKTAPPVEEGETYEEGGTYEEGEPVYEEPVPEGEIAEEGMAEPSEEYAPAEPEIEGEEIPAEAPEPVPPETQEEQEAQAGGGGGGGELPKFTEAQEDIEGYKSDSYEYSPISQYQKDEIGTGLPIKDTVAQPLEPKTEEDKHKEILENVEKLYPPDAELETLKQKITDHKKEIEGKATVIQDVKSDFENIQGGLDSLKNTLESLVGEIQSTVQELTATRVKETKPPQTLVEPRKKPTRETTRPTIIPQKRRSVGKRKTSLKKAQIILKELNRRVEKLEHIYVY